MLTITPINNNNYSIYSRKIKNQESPEIIEAPSVDSVSFQGKNIAKSDKSVLSFLKLPFTALAERYNAYKEHRIDTKVAEARIGAFLSSESRVYRDINYKENKKLLLEAYSENEELTKGLMKKERGNDLLGELPYYNSKEIAAIVKANKEDPELAYKLASTLGNNPEISSSDIEVIEQNLRDNAGIVRLFKQDSSKDTARVLRAYQMDPVYTSQAYEFVHPSNLAAFIELRKNYPEEVNKLTLREDVMLTPDVVAKLSPVYKKKTSQVEDFLKITKGKDYALFNIYLQYPEFFTKFWGKILAPEMLEKVCRAYSTAGKYCEMASQAQMWGITDIARFALAAKNTEPFFDAVKEKNPNIKLDNVESLKEFSVLYQDEKNKLNFKRMLEDGRCSSLEDMISMLSVYKKNPNTKITDRQILLKDDALAELFNLK